MKRAVVGVLAVGLFLTGVGSAVADSWRPIQDATTVGAVFEDAEYRFNPPERNHGSFEWRGSLRDDSDGDGHNVYLQVRVEGLAWARYNGKQRQSVRLHNANWVGAQRYISKAELRVCRNRGSLHPDNCSHIRKFFVNR
ncbi:hypothetical protein QFZ56_002698 [Streptomyces achromogenes]|uniref:Secreted protein n=1 Tax=Streptomyces achromogenes TaxID=67255 RepID=A0ABU0PZ98_STRAH|nr:hypothetical protein [Streptomyces achromogenes]MDQ0683735.1 hypothetical protein [Streptomyces achromogenes]